MDSLPRYCQELRELRGDISSSDVAKHCGVSRQFIRQVETGLRAPSNAILTEWLKFLGIELQSQPGLIRSISSHRAYINSYIKEYEELNSMIETNDEFPLVDFLNEVAHLISEGGYLPSEFVENRIYLIRQAYEQRKR
jgi:transcriptional regulator with XRE-family HTH domain